MLDVPTQDIFYLSDRRHRDVNSISTNRARHNMLVDQDLRQIDSLLIDGQFVQILDKLQCLKSATKSRPSQFEHYLD